LTVEVVDEGLVVDRVRGLIVEVVDEGLEVDRVRGLTGKVDLEAVVEYLADDAGLEVDGVRVEVF
jgi:hypothetical protein